MGASTVAQLIAKGKAENGYNNSGISTDNQWIDFFNDALRDLVDDLGIEKVTTINFTTGTREYDLPEDYFMLSELRDGFKRPVPKRRYYDQEYPSGYWLFNRGSNYVIDLYNYQSSQTFTMLYQAYAPALVPSNKNTERPAVPSVGEKSLIYYAISKALRNNSQIGMAQDYEALYEKERMKIRNAVARGGG